MKTMTVYLGLPLDERVFLGIKGNSDGIRVDVLVDGVKVGFVAIEKTDDKIKALVSDRVPVETPNAAYTLWVKTEQVGGAL